MTGVPNIDSMLNQEAPLALGQQDDATGISPTAEEPIGEIKVYQVDAENPFIPVSKACGSVWAHRRRQAAMQMEPFTIAWDEAEQYYNNDQLEHRTVGVTKRAGNRGANQEHSSKFTETENVIYSTVNGILPYVYSQNPSVSITMPGPMEPLGRVSEKLLHGLMRRKAAPGLNLKKKVRKHVMRALLKNMSYLEIGYQQRTMPSGPTAAELSNLAKELETADEKRIAEIEGVLRAVDLSSNVRVQPGPWVRVVDAALVLRDPWSEDEDFGEDDWLMIGEFFPTQQLQAQFATKLENGQITLKFEPTHVFTGGPSDKSQEDINNFKLLTTSNTDYKRFGYNNRTAFESQCRTLVWKVWDRSTRRVLWFMDNDWTWPLWVWDVPFYLDQFFPLYPLSFHQPPTGVYARGEVTYALDQQDRINAIASTVSQAAEWGRGKFLYNSTDIEPGEAQKIIDQKSEQLLGVKMAPGANPTQAIYSMVPPALQFYQMFDKQGAYNAIDAVFGTSQITRGGEFKTNTTNQAIDQYTRGQSVRLDEKIDQVEDSVGSCLFGILQLCLQFMPVDMVTMIVGEDVQQVWRNVQDPRQLSAFVPEIVAGSTTKPDSANKRQEATQVAQVLGQFAGASPAFGMVALRALSRAYSEVVIMDDEWDALKSALSGGLIDTQQLDQLPPPAKQAFAMAIMKGVPAAQALQEITQQLGGAGGQSQQQPGAASGGGQPPAPASAQR